MGRHSTKHCSAGNGIPKVRGGDERGQEGRVGVNKIDEASNGVSSYTPSMVDVSINTILGEAESGGYWKRFW